MDIHIFGSPDRTSAEAELEIFRSSGRTEMRKAELHIFGSQGRAEVRKRSFSTLEVLAERYCECFSSDLGSQDRTEVQKRSFTSLDELAEQKCGTEIMSRHG